MSKDYPTGVIVYDCADILDPKKIPCNGAWVSKTTYAKLYAYALTTNYATTESSWRSRSVRFLIPKTPISGHENDFRVPDLISDYSGTNGFVPMCSSSTSANKKVGNIIDHTHDIGSGGNLKEFGTKAVVPKAPFKVVAASLFNMNEVELLPIIIYK